MEEQSVKKLAVIVIASLLIFWIFKPKGEGGDNGVGGLFQKKREPIKKPTITDRSVLEDEQVAGAYEALCVYIDAYNNNESESDLQEIKKAFRDEMGIVIYTDATGKLAVKDVDGDDVLVYS